MTTNEAPDAANTTGPRHAHTLASVELKNRVACGKVPANPA